MTTTKNPQTPARARVKACDWAHSELAARHPDEYRALYNFYCEQLGVETRETRKSSTRPSADEVKARNGAAK